MKNKPSKLASALRQGYQGLTAGLGDEAIDYAALLPAYAISKYQNGKEAPTLEEMRIMARELSRDDLQGDQAEHPYISGGANLAGSVVGGAMAGPKLLAQTGLGALSGAASANGDIGDRVKGGIEGGVFGLGGQLAAKGVNRVAKGASDLIAPEVKKTAAKLKAMGIPVRLSQLMDSKFLSAVDMAISKVPFSGANASQDAQRKAFTKQLTKTFGEDADVLDSDVLSSAKTRLSSAYDNLLGKTDIPIDRQAFAQQLSQTVDDLSLENTDEGAAFLAKQADNILNTIDNNGGKLTGKAYQKLRQTLKGAKGNNYSVGGIQKLLDDTVRQSVPDNIGQQLGAIDGQYRNMKIGEKIYGQLQNSDGKIKPETLYNAAKSNIGDIAYGGGGELGDLARGGRILKPTIPDSGSISQAIGAGALGSAGVGALFNPAIAAGALGTIGTARGIDKAMTSKYLQEGLSPAIQGAAGALEKSGIVPSIMRTGQQAAQSDIAPYSPENDPQLKQMVNGYNPDQDPELQKLLGPQQPNKYGNRLDGTPKGSGFLGELQNENGDVSTELSIGVNIDGKEMDVPSLVPTLSPDEVKWMLSGKKPTEAIARKASDFAIQRLRQGESPFADNSETPKAAGQQGYNPDADPELQKLLAPEQHGQAQSPDLMQRMAMAESGGNPNAHNPNSSASGTYQFTDPTWRGMVKNYGAQTGITEADKNNPEKQQIMAQLLTEENANMYRKNGIEPNDADLYMAHFLGGPGAVKAKQNPNAYGAEILPKAAASNKNIFYKNGQPRTVDEIYQLLGNKVRNT